MTFRKIILTVTTLVVTVFYYRVDPSQADYLPQCTIRKLFGIYCWGCGGQSAFHHFLHLNLSEAFRSNLLLFPVLLIGLAVYTGEMTGKREKIYKMFRNKFLGIFLVILIIVFTVLRNFLPAGTLIQ